jgi:hypothetical protein
MLQKLLSYLLPITIARVHSAISGPLVLQRYKGQLALLSPKACYSYGTKYNPFLVGFQHVRDSGWKLPQKFLLLGGAMMSAVQILKEVHAHSNFTSTVIELDPTIIGLNKAHHSPEMLRNTYLQQGNAVLYIAACVSLYDCIAVDIFVDMDIPAEATTRAFLKDCKRCLSGNGYIIYNAYFSTAAELKNFSELFYQVFPYAVQIKHDVNTIFISTSGA